MLGGLDVALPEVLERHAQGEEVQLLRLLQQLLLRHRVLNNRYGRYLPIHLKLG